MKKLMAMVLVCLAAIGAVTAQDWRTDEENGLRYNCELVGALVADFGEESMIRTESGAKQGLADFLNYLFPIVRRAGQRSAHRNDRVRRRENGRGAL